MRTFTTALSLLALAALNQTNAIELTSEAQAVGRDECKVYSGVPAPADFAANVWFPDYDHTAEGVDISLQSFQSENDAQNQVTDEPLEDAVGYLECSTRGGKGRHMLVTIDYEFADGNIQSASYQFERTSKYEVPLDSELLSDGGIGGAATKTFSMDSMDTMESYAIAYAEPGCQGVQQVIQGTSQGEFEGFNKAEIVTPVLSIGGSGSGRGGRGGSGRGGSGRGGRGGRLAQVEQSVTWSATYAKSFMLKVKVDEEGVVPEGYSLRTAPASGTYEFYPEPLVTEYNVCVENTDATRVYAKIMGVE